MVLKKCYINNKVYGSVSDEPENSKFTINGDVTAAKKIRHSNCDSNDLQDKQYLEDFFTLLAVCHEVFPEDHPEKGLIYQGASPDDIALTAGAQQLGIEFKEKVYSKMKIVNHLTDIENYFELITIMPFDSDRKRMSVLVKDCQSNKYVVLSKGADTMMLPRLQIDKMEKEEIEKAIKIFSKEGLRVLCLGRKEIEKDEYELFINSLNSARNNGEDLNSIYETVECELKFLGCTALEDKLQDGVSDAIYSLLTCNIRIWVLTGDKQDTAEEIAKSCKLINENMFTFYFYKEENVSSEEKLNKMILDYEIDIDSEKIDMELISKKIRKKNKNKDMSIMIDGLSLAEILKTKELMKKFFYVATAAKSVVCCRVSPKQKAKVVHLAKTFGDWVTLSIGDGANDVPMILEAHIGVGIQGKEGTQAVRSSDFAIGQFRFLERLILIYGRNGYIKIGKFICYYFYKNVMLVLTDTFFAFQNGLSGQIYFADWLITCYNALFTSWPCIMTFSLEKDVDINIVKKFPMLYCAGQEGFYFNLKMFWSYLIYSLIHAVLSFYISQFGMNYINDFNGMTLDHWAKSTISFSIIIHVVTYKLLIISTFWNGLNIFSCCFAMVFYYLALITLCSETVSKMFNDQLGGRFFILVSIPKFFIVMAVAPFLVLIPDIVFKMLFYLGYPNPSEYITQHLKDDEIIKIIEEEESKVDKLFTAEFKECDKMIQLILQKARKAKQSIFNDSFLTDQIIKSPSNINQQEKIVELNNMNHNEEFDSLADDSQNLNDSKFGINKTDITGNANQSAYEDSQQNSATLRVKSAKNSRKSERSDRSKQSERSERSGKSEKSERLAKSGKSDGNVDKKSNNSISEENKDEVEKLKSKTKNEIYKEHYELSESFHNSSYDSNLKGKTESKNVDGSPAFNPSFKKKEELAAEKINSDREVLESIFDADNAYRSIEITEIEENPKIKENPENKAVSLKPSLKSSLKSINENSPQKVKDMTFNNDLNSNNNESKNNNQSKILDDESLNAPREQNANKRKMNLSEDFDYDER